MNHPLLALALACFTTAHEKGWWDDQKQETSPALDQDKVWEIVPEKLTLVHSEVSEALEDYRVAKMNTTENAKGKPEGFRSEVADVVIRVFDLAGALEIDLLGPDCATQEPLPNEGNPSVLLAHVHREISHALTAWEEGDLEALISHLSRVVWFCDEIVSRVGGILQEEVERKMAYNRTRPYRHGGKVC